MKIMESVFEFTAYNAETYYAYGTEREAIKYLAELNRDRDCNLYEMGASSISDVKAEMSAMYLCGYFNDDQ
jgi:hypothetical protein